MAAFQRIKAMVRSAQPENQGSGRLHKTAMVSWCNLNGGFGIRGFRFLVFLIMGFVACGASADPPTPSDHGTTGIEVPGE